MFGIDGWEWVVLFVVGLIVIGPQRLPEYTRTLVQWVREIRKFVETSRASVESEMGIAVEELKKYDPRQYDPRRIVREAWGDTDPLTELVEDTKTALSATGAAAATVGATQIGSEAGADASEPDLPRRAPFDPEAT